MRALPHLRKLIINQLTNLKVILMKRCHCFRSFSSNTIRRIASGASHNPSLKKELIKFMQLNQRALNQFRKQSQRISDRLQALNKVQ